MGETAVGQDARTVVRERLIALAGLLTFTLAGFFLFPGHTWLQSDTQIYVAILEHLREPAVLRGDIVATRPHVTWTIYDETARALSAVTGLGFKEVLQAEQILFRFLGLMGVFLMGRAMSLGLAGSLLVTGLFSLGATVNGPAVLTLEYEPVPRGFAVMLVFAAMGYASRERFGTAGIFGAVAFLYHPPTAIPFWVCAILYWPFERHRKDVPRMIAPFAAAAVILLAAAWLQSGEHERQDLFGRIDPALEALQRMRATYNWISMWPPAWFWQYPALFVFVAAAWWRLRGAMTAPLRWFSLSLPVYAILMMPASYLTLEVSKWSLIPQFQPARALLFVTGFAVVLGAAAAWRAAQSGQWAESFGWLLVPFAVPANGLVLLLSWTRVALVAALGLAAIGAAAVARKRQILGSSAVVLVVSCAMLLIPGWGGMRNFPALHSEELEALSSWARSNTPAESVFLFADAGRRLEAGIFRAEALRTIYVDWKGGGQVNLMKRFADDWRGRWEQTGKLQTPLQQLSTYRDLGVDYLVVSPRNLPVGVNPAYATADFAVIALPR